MIRKNIVVAFVLSAFPVVSAAQELEFDGVVFPDGAASFADQVVSYSPGGGGPIGDAFNDPAGALGIPDAGPADNDSVSLGHSGVLVLEFTDNALTTSGDNSLDLWIFESGPSVEPFEVSISQDGTNFVALGRISGQPAGIDIDAFVGNGVILGELYTHVMLVDGNARLSGTPFPGADIDAVGAITTIRVPEPTSAAIAGLSVLWHAAHRRRRSTRFE